MQPLRTHVMMIGLQDIQPTQFWKSKPNKSIKDLIEKLYGYISHPFPNIIQEISSFRTGTCQSICFYSTLFISSSQIIFIYTKFKHFLLIFSEFSCGSSSRWHWSQAQFCHRHGRYPPRSYRVIPAGCYCKSSGLWSSPSCNVSTLFMKIRCISQNQIKKK